MPEPGRRTQHLTARQAADRLGVKVETVYAYVSRGVLERSASDDGRSSLFEVRAIERLAERRRGTPRVGGLSIVIGSALTLIEDERVCYRGLDVADLARRASFEAVAAWLWLGVVQPTADDIDPTAWRATPDALAAARNAQRSLPEGTKTADRLRAIVSVVAPIDALRFDAAPEAMAACARRLIATLVEGLPAVGPDTAEPLEIPGAPPRVESIAARLWPRLTARHASAADIRALNGALVLIADHGLAASTLAARVAASVRADPYSIAAAGLGTLAGALHGAASALVHRLLAEVSTPERAVAVIGEFLRRESRIPGFGHLIYKGWDPRARALMALLRASDVRAERLAVVDRVLELLEERTSVRPNVDFALGALSYCADMPESAGETLFGVARTAGWLAHAIEEFDEPPVRFRPRGEYVGRKPDARRPGA